MKIPHCGLIFINMNFSVASPDKSDNSACKYASESVTADGDLPGD
jgi:hypothetical protein